jgi:hypothetical protein
MYEGNNCGKRKRFNNGITNGADWYVIEGGMQDYNYFVSNAIELSVELSCCKYVPENQLSVEWHKVLLLLCKIFSKKYKIYKIFTHFVKI